MLRMLLQISYIPIDQPQPHICIHLYFFKTLIVISQQQAIQHTGILVINEGHGSMGVPGYAGLMHIYGLLAGGYILEVITQDTATLDHKEKRKIGHFMQ